MGNAGPSSHSFRPTQPTDPSSPASSRAALTPRLLTPLQPHWPPQCYSGATNTLLPQGLCTGCSLCLKCFPLRPLQSQPPLRIQISFRHHLLAFCHHSDHHLLRVILCVSHCSTLVPHNICIEMTLFTCLLIQCLFSPLGHRAPVLLPMAWHPVGASSVLVN